MQHMCINMSMPLQDILKSAICD